ncbi:hypothetical protein AMATHDRAFT_793 [Amanita thiersii Skay4041]|uniref:Fe2OG dioxygenase domain-containing protein n=1 Tax=Amanita thiersii Skay4041 TaxID=703135 RepID=A0A2A9NV74_9AGAR|nr:hypothetical protein AMATHDRAFT_793 [Amanita thiersii Skay4041]
MTLLQDKASSDSQAIAFDSIPVIDLVDIRSSDTNTRQVLANQVRDACINVGFFYVKNHGIPEDVISNALEMSKRFFDLPLESKMKIENKTTANFKGYAPLLSANNDSEGSGDLHEGLQFGWEEIDQSTGPRGEDIDGAMTGANVWPTEIPNFRETVLTYYHAAVQLGKLLFPIFALALELPEDFFEDKVGVQVLFVIDSTWFESSIKTRYSAAIMSLLHYPPQTGHVDDRVIGIGAHTDWECFTILWQEPGIQALQVLNTSNQWVNAPPTEGALVINLGDQFARWTNDVFKSTVHRAINRSGVRRYSVPLFFGTDYNVKLEPIPSCVSSSRPPKYEVITAGEYVKMRFQAAYGQK